MINSIRILNAVCVILLGWTALASDLTCHFWQPDQEVLVHSLPAGETELRLDLIGSGEYVLVSQTSQHGLSVSLFDQMHNLLMVSRAKKSKELNLSFEKPRFSISCFN